MSLNSMVRVSSAHYPVTIELEPNYVTILTTGENLHANIRLYDSMRRLRSLR
jgi:hypothetical protein